MALSDTKIVDIKEAKEEITIGTGQGELNLQTHNGSIKIR